MPGTPGFRHPSFPSTGYESMSVNQAPGLLSVSGILSKRYVKFKPLLVSQLGARQNVKPTKASAVTVAAVANTTPRISRRIVGVCRTKAPVMCRVSRASQGLPAMRWRAESGVAYTGGYGFILDLLDEREKGRTWELPDKEASPDEGSNVLSYTVSNNIFHCL